MMYMCTPYTMYHKTMFVIFYDTIHILQEENKRHIFVTICFVNCDGLFACVGAGLAPAQTRQS